MHKNNFTYIYMSNSCCPLTLYIQQEMFRIQLSPILSIRSFKLYLLKCISFNSSHDGDWSCSISWFRGAFVWQRPNILNYVTAWGIDNVICFQKNKNPDSIMLCIKQYTFHTHKYWNTIIIYQLSRALYQFWDLLSHFVLPQYTH
jgi:hypothetical protein